MSCFPQMKPEPRGGDQEKGGMGEAAPPELSEEEKLVLKLLKEKSPTDLNELKGKTGLSNKKWDKAIKGLTKNGIAKVEKNDEGLWVSVL